MARLINADGADRLDVLVSVDQSCHCVLSAFGVFQVRAYACGYLRFGVVRWPYHSCKNPRAATLTQIVQMDLRAKLGMPPSHAAAVMRALCVDMKPDFSQLRILFCRAQSGPGDVAYAHIATPLLRSSALELCMVARGGHRVQLLLDSIGAAIASCVRQLGDANTAVGDKLAEFSALLRDHGSQATASEEFMSLLITGVARRELSAVLRAFSSDIDPPPARSAATNQFMSQTLGIGGLKRLSKMVDAGLATVHSMLTDQLRPAIEGLLLRMSELSGLALWSERSDLTGLKREGCEQSIALAEKLLASIAQAIVACRAAASTYRNWFLWMQRVQKRRVKLCW